MRIADEFQASICPDCVLLDANGEVPEDRPVDAPALLSVLVPEGINPNDVCIDISGPEGEPIEPYFSWSSCDGCGDRLGGDRFDATVTVFAERA